MKKTRKLLASKRNKIQDLQKAEELSTRAMTAKLGGFIDGIKVRGVTSLPSKRS